MIIHENGLDTTSDTELNGLGLGINNQNNPIQRMTKVKTDEIKQENESEENTETTEQEETQSELTQQLYLAETELEKLKNEYDKWKEETTKKPILYNEKHENIFKEKMLEEQQKIDNIMNNPNYDNRTWEQKYLDKQKAEENKRIDSTYQRTTEDMRKAGLNPFMTYGSGGTIGTASSQMASSSSKKENEEERKRRRREEQRIKKELERKEKELKLQNKKLYTQAMTMLALGTMNALKPRKEK